MVRQNEVDLQLLDGFSTMFHHSPSDINQAIWIYLGYPWLSNSHQQGEVLQRSLLLWPKHGQDKRRVLTAFKLLQSPSGTARLGDWLQRPWAPWVVVWHSHRLCQSEGRSDVLGDLHLVIFPDAPCMEYLLTKLGLFGDFGGKCW